MAADRVPVGCCVQWRRLESRKAKRHSTWKTSKIIPMERHSVSTLLRFLLPAILVGAGTAPGFRYCRRDSQQNFLPFFFLLVFYSPSVELEYSASNPKPRILVRAHRLLATEKKRDCKIVSMPKGREYITRLENLLPTLCWMSE